MFTMEIYLYQAFEKYPLNLKVWKSFWKKKWLVTGDLLKQIDLTIFRE